MKQMNRKFLATLPNKVIDNIRHKADEIGLGRHSYLEDRYLKLNIIEPDYQEALMQYGLVKKKNEGFVSMEYKESIYVNGMFDLYVNYEVEVPNRHTLIVGTAASERGALMIVNGIRKAYIDPARIIPLGVLVKGHKNGDRKVIVISATFGDDLNIFVKVEEI